MSPLTNSAIVHPDWSKHHQPMVETAMRSTVDILRPLSESPEPTFPPSDEEWSEVAAPDVPARIYALSTGNALAQSGQTLDTTDYLVQIPVDALTRILVGEDGHRIRVTNNPESPDIVGRVFSIMGVQHSTEAFNRDLVVREHTTQQQGGTP